MIIKSGGALTFVHRVRKDGKAKGTIARNNIEEALLKGRGNIVIRDRKTNRWSNEN